MDKVGRCRRNGNDPGRSVDLSWGRVCDSNHQHRRKAASRCVAMVWDNSNTPRRTVDAGWKEWLCGNSRRGMPSADYEDMIQALGKQNTDRRVAMPSKAERSTSREPLPAP